MDENKFFTFKLHLVSLYCIGIYNDTGIVCNDKLIAQLLDMEENDYTNLVKKFGGIFDSTKGLVFIFEYEAHNFVNYLNEYYLVALKLAGKVI